MEKGEEWKGMGMAEEEANHVECIIVLLSARSFRVHPRGISSNWAELNNRISNGGDGDGDDDGMNGEEEEKEEEEKEM